MTRWFRLYDDVINDPKLLKLPEGLRWAWVALLCVASKNGGQLPPVDDVALLLRVPEAKAGEYITKLVKAKLIDNENGVFVPHNWEGRQFKSDTSNDRVKRHRDNKRNVTPKQECNVTGGVTSTVTETAPEAEAEAEAETEADSEQSRADAGALVDEDLKRREAGLRAGIGAHFAARGQKLPSNTERVGVWLSQGYATGTVLSAVEAVLKRGKPVSTLEYFDGAIRDAHAKAAPENLQVVSSKVFVIVGTPGWISWDTESRAKNNGRGLPTTQHRVDNTIHDGWWCASEFHPGWDEATGEKLAPSGDEAAA
jgi:hypothetical protein